MKATYETFTIILNAENNHKYRLSTYLRYYRVIEATGDFLISVNNGPASYFSAGMWQRFEKGMITQLDFTSIEDVTLVLAVCPDGEVGDDRTQLINGVMPVKIESVNNNYKMVNKYLTKVGGYDAKVRTNLILEPTENVGVVDYSLKTMFLNIRQDGVTADKVIVEVSSGDFGVVGHIVSEFHLTADDFVEVYSGDWRLKKSIQITLPEIAYSDALIVSIKSFQKYSYRLTYAMEERRVA